MKLSRKELLVQYAAAALLPLLAVLHLFQKNFYNLDSGQVLVLCLILSGISLILFFLFSKIFRSFFLSFCVVTILWCFTFFLPSREFVTISVYTRQLIVFFAVVAALLTVGIILRKKQLQAVFSCLFIFEIAMLLMTGYSIFRVRSAEKKENAEARSTFQQTRSDEQVFKEEFHITPELSHPVIYWIHADGMLGIMDMNRYFNEPQKEFLSFLSSNDFMLDENASFEGAHHTNTAVPALLCPFFYDEAGKDILQSYAENFYEQSKILSFDENLFVEARNKNELVNAFKAAGYQTEIINDNPQYGYPNISDEYFTSYYRSVDDEGEKTNIPTVLLGERSQQLDNLMKLIFPEKIYQKFFKSKKSIKVNVKHEVFNLKEQRDQYDYMLSGLEYSNRFHEKYLTIWDTDAFFHSPFTCLADGTPIKPPTDDLKYYAGNHLYYSNILEQIIRNILQADPDAVIVIQADHGLHTQTVENFAKYFNQNEEEAKKTAVELWNSVMSAVRVPEKYRNEDFHFAYENPLNISRWLINTFVGKNYEYLSQP